MQRRLDDAALDQPQHGLAGRTLIAVDLVAGRRPLDVDRHSLDVAFNAARRRAHGGSPNSLIGVPAWEIAATGGLIPDTVIFRWPMG